MGKKKEEETFEVERIVDSRQKAKKVQYMVKWKGYPSSENTWEPVSNLEDVLDMVEAYEAKKGTKSCKDEPAKHGPGRPPKSASPDPPAKKQREEKKVSLADFDFDSIVASLAKAVKKAKKEKASAINKKESKEKKEKKEKMVGGTKKEGAEKGDVVEVDKITGVRSRKSGLQYKILWKDGTMTWEPEDNVMDDDLVDEFEEAEQIKVYGDAVLSVGSEVEVKSVEEGFGNSWSAAVVTKKVGSKFTVEYSSFTDEKGKPLNESGLERKRLRLVPEPAEKGWEPIVGEIVEVNEDDCWWEARVESLPAARKAELKFRVSDEIKTVALGRKVRPCSWLTMGK